MEVQRLNKLIKYILIEIIGIIFIFVGFSANGIFAGVMAGAGGLISGFALRAISVIIKDRENGN